MCSAPTYIHAYVRMHQHHTTLSKILAATVVVVVVVLLTMFIMNKILARSRCLHNQVYNHRPLSLVCTMHHILMRVDDILIFRRADRWPFDFLKCTWTSNFQNSYSALGPGNVVSIVSESFSFPGGTKPIGN